MRSAAPVNLASPDRDPSNDHPGPAARLTRSALDARGWRALWRGRPILPRGDGLGRLRTHDATLTQQLTRAEIVSLSRDGSPGTYRPCAGTLPLPSVTRRFVAPCLPTNGQTVRASRSGPMIDRGDGLN